jgi:hypothetical protein
MSTKLAAFPLDFRKEIQEAILSLEVEPMVGESCSGCCTKPARAAIYRCLECFSHKPLCSVCIVDCHFQQPLHQIQKWTNGFFSKVSLYDIGHIMYLGHGGERCPCNKGHPNTLVVVHTNGIHQRSIHYCKCRPFSRNEDKVLQLVRHQLFPPTVELPQTVFTFDVLDHFHQHSLSAKTSAYDYFNALRRQTNAAFPHLVPVSV